MRLKRIVQRLVEVILIVTFVLFLNFISRNSKQQSTQLLSPSSTTNPTDITDWKVYDDPVYGYSIKYPPEWNLTVGNSRDPALPEDAVAIEKGRYAAVIVAVETILNDDKFTSKQFREISGNSQITTTEFTKNGLTARRAEVIQEGIGDTKLKLIYTFFPVGKQVYYLYTVFRINPETEALMETEEEEELKIFDLIVSSFTLK